MAITSTFSGLYTQLRKDLSDPAGGSTEGGTPRWTLNEKKEAINAAIRDAFPIVADGVVDESTTMVAATYSYTCPASLKRAQDLREVWSESSTSGIFIRQISGWYCYDNAGAPKLYLDEVWNATKKLRLVFVTPPSALSADADTTTVPMSFVLARAKFYLHQQASERAAMTDMELHNKQATEWWGISEAMLARIAAEQGQVVPTTEKQKAKNK